MNNPEEIKKEEIKKEEQIKESSEEEKSEKASIVEEGSINLIPVMSGEDIKEEKRKVRMNKASLISLLFLLGVSIIVIGFSIITRVQLNYQKEKLFKYEEELSSFNQIIIDNDQILERVALYDDVQKDRYSITKVVNYIQSILLKSVNSSFSSFDFAGSTGISFRGETRDLEELAKLWHLLVNDPKLEKVQLKSLSKGTGSVSFVFEAHIILDEFILLAEI